MRVTTLAPAIRASADAGRRRSTPSARAWPRGRPRAATCGFEALPWVSAETVRHYYGHYQKSLTTRFTGDGGRTAGVHPAPAGKHRLPMLGVLRAIQRAARAHQEAGGARVTWLDLYRDREGDRVNDGQGGTRSRRSRGDYSGFVRGCKGAWTALGLPWTWRE